MHCRLCEKKIKVDKGGFPMPCGCEYTDAMRARDVLERTKDDINLAANLLDKVIGHNIIRGKEKKSTVLIAAPKKRKRKS